MCVCVYVHACVRVCVCVIVGIHCIFFVCMEILAKCNAYSTELVSAYNIIYVCFSVSGFRTAFHLAARGAHVILACRHMTRASRAVTQIQSSVVGIQGHTRIYTLS